LAELKAREARAAQKEIGKTKDVGFQVGVRRTFPNIL
jgi:hypothetical protein